MYYTREEWDKLTDEQKVGNQCLDDISLADVFKDGDMDEEMRKMVDKIMAKQGQKAKRKKR